MAAKKCLICNCSFRGRADARTCSPRCRKRLQLVRDELVGRPAPAGRRDWRQATRKSGLLILLGLSSLLGLVSSSPPQAQALTAASNLNFQARLLNAAGAVVPDGNYNIDFKIYNADSTTGTVGTCSGSCLWEETRKNFNSQGVAVTNGYFSVNLGSITSFSSTINWDQQLYLTMNIGGTSAGSSPTWDGEMQNAGHSIALTSVPLAFRANQLAVAGTNEQILQFASSTFGQATTISLQDPGATTANICYETSGGAVSHTCAAATGGSGYIQNSTGGPQSANFNIISAASGSIGAIIHANASQSVDILDVNDSTATVYLGVSSNGSLSVSPATAGTITLGTTGETGTITVGKYNGASTSIINIGDNAASSTTQQVNIGASGAGVNTVTIGSTSSTSATTIEGSNTGINIGTSTTAHTISIATGGTNTQAVTIGSINGSSSVTIQGGTTGTNVSLQAGTSGTIAIGTANANAVNIGQSGGNAVAINSGNANISLTTNGASNPTVLVKSSQNSTAAFQVQNSSSGALLTVDTSSNNLVKIGSSTTDATAILNVLDSYNNGTDPTGVNGGMYYNTSLNAFRCYQNSTWVNCAGSGAGTLSASYNAGSTSGDQTLNLDNAKGGGVILKDNSTPITGSLFTIQNNGGTSKFLDVTSAKITVGENTLGNAAATATTATTSGTGTNTTTVVLTAVNSLANGDVIFIDNAGQDYFTRITAGGGTTSLTVDPAVTYENARTVTKYNVQYLGSDGTNFSGATRNQNSFYQGYFLGGVVTGAGSTVYSDANIQSANNLKINTSTGVNIQGTNSTTAFQIQNSAGSSALNIDTATNTNIVANGSAETGTTGWAALGSASLTQSAAQQYVGANSLAITTTAAANDGAKYPLTTTTLASNTKYTLSLMARLAPGQSMATFQVGRAEDGSTFTSCLTAQTVSSSGWTNFSCTFTTGTTSSTPFIYVRQTDATARTIYVDAVQLTRFSLLTNASIEQAIAGNWAVKGSAAVTQDATQFTDGANSLKIVTTAANNDGAKQSITLSDSTLYTVTFQAINTGAAFATMEAGYSSDGSTDNTACMTGQTVNAAWTNFTCTFVTPSSHSGTPYFYIKQTNNVVHTFYVDAVQLVQGNPTNSYREGIISINDTIGSPLILQNQADSTAAFQIQNAAGTNILNLDSSNLKVTLNQSNFYVTDLSAPASPGVAAGANTGGTLSGAAGTTYYYKVTALNAAGESLSSSEVSINGQSFTKLSVPGASTVAIGAAGNVTGTYTYRVTFVTANGETTVGTTSASVSPSAQQVNLTAIPLGATGTTGRNVYRCDSGGNNCLRMSAGTTIANNTTTTLTDNTASYTGNPAPPGANTATTSTNNATVTWTAVTGATGYRVYRGTTAGAESAYQTSASSPFTDTGAAGTAGTVHTYSSVDSIGIGTAAPAANLDVEGTALFKNAANSVSAFQVQDAGGNSILNVDSTNRLIGISNSTPTATLDVVASSTFFSDTFESGVLSPFTTTGIWAPTTASSHGGSYSVGGAASAGDLSLVKTLPSSGTISMWMYIHSGCCATPSTFKIDGVTQTSFSPNTTYPWAYYSYSVSAGTHTFYWAFNYTQPAWWYVDDVNITLNTGSSVAAAFNGGNVGIGTSTPGSALEVDGTAAFKLPTASNAFQIQNGAGAQILAVDATTNSISIAQGNLSVSGLANILSVPTLTSSSTGGTLAAGTYYYQVAAVNINGTTPAIATNPTSVTTSGSTSQNTVTWSAMTNASGYNVYRSTNGTTWFVNSVTSGTTTLVDNGSTYTWATSGSPPTTNTTGGNLSVKGSATFANASNSTSALDVQDATGDSILRVDSTDRHVGINNSAPVAALDVVASPPAPDFTWGFEDGTYGALSHSGRFDVSAAGAHSGSYGWWGDTCGNSSDTMTLTRSLGSAGYISFWAQLHGFWGGWNVFWIDGVAKIALPGGTIPYALYTYPLSAGSHTFQWNTGDTCDYIYVDDITVGTNAPNSNAAVFNGGNVGIGTVAPSATLEVDGNSIFKSPTNTTSVLQVQNAVGDSLFNADTTNRQITIGRFVDGSLSAPASPGAAAGSNQGGTLSGAAGTTYYYKVSAMTVDGETPLSSEVSINGAAFTALTAPTAPTVGAPAAGGSVTLGTHSYKVTFVTANGETTGGTTSSQVNVTTGGTQTVPLTAIPTGPTGTTARKIYRTVTGDTGNYKLDGTLGDNSTTTFNDTVADGSLGANAPASNTATTNTNNATISWTAVTGATGYRVYRSTTSGAENSYQVAASSPFTDTGAAGTTLTNTSLAVKGTASIQNAVDSTTTFQVQNAAGSQLLNINSLSQNLVTNPSIEQAISGNWTTKGTGSTVTQTASQQYIGANALSVVTTGTANAGAQESLTLTASTTYTLMMYVKAYGSSSINTINIGRQDQSGTDLDCLTGQTISNNLWTKLSCTFTTGATISSSNIYIKDTGTNHTFFVDAIQLTAFSVLTNPSVEQAIAGNWTAYGSPTTFQQTASQHYDATHALQIVESASTGQGAQQAKTLSVSTTYSLTFYVFSSTSFSTLNVGYSSTGAGGGEIDCLTGISTLSNNWTQYNCTFTTPGTTSGSPYVYFKDTGASHTWYLDAVELTVGPPVVAYPNGAPAAGSFFTNPNSTYQDSGITLNGVIQSPVAFQNQSNSTSAFQIQNANGTQLLNVDSANNRITVDASLAPMNPPTQNNTSTSTTGGSLAATTYYYKITALDSAGGESLPSAEKSQVTTGSTSTVTLSWVPVSGATSYRIYRGTTALGGSGSEVYLLTTIGIQNGANINYVDTGSVSAGTATPPTTGNAYSATNNFNNNLQLVVGGISAPTGQLYVSGSLPATYLVDYKTASTSNDIKVQGRYAYIAGSSLEVVDISNPSAPTKVGVLSFGTGKDSLFVKGKYAYVTDNVNTSMTIVDISNPAAPTSVSTVVMGGDGSSNATNVYVQDNYAYVVDNNNLALYIYNITNPASPSLVSQTPVIDGPEAVYVQGKYAYVTTYKFCGTSHLQIFDVSNPSAVVTKGNVGYSSCSAISGVSVVGRYAYTGDSGGNLSVVDVANPSTPVLVSTIGSGPRTTFVQGHLLVGADAGGQALKVYDISNPANPVKIASVDAAHNTNDAVMSGRYAFEVTASSHMMVFDLGGAYLQQVEAGGVQTTNLTVDANSSINGDETIQGGLSVGQSLQVVGSLGINGGTSFQGGVMISGTNNQLGAPTGTPTVTPTGTTGAQRWDYVITAINATGGESTASATGTTSTGNATLTASNYNAISWTAVSGATGYRIYRTYATGATSPTSTGYIGTATTNSFNDTGYIGVGNSAPSTDTTGQLTVLGSGLFKNSSNSSSAFQVQDASAVTLLGVDTTSRIILVSGDTTTFANLTLTNAHFKSTQTNPPAAGTISSCGTSPTLTFTSGDTDDAGSFYLTSGSSTTGTCSVQINFNKSFGAAPKSVIMQVTQSIGSATTSVTPIVTATTASSFTFKLSATDTTSTVYAFYYWIVE